MADGCQESEFVQHKLVPVLTPLGLPARATDSSAFTLVTKLFYGSVCLSIFVGNFIPF